jgi:hypothetical protein
MMYDVVGFAYLEYLIVMKVVIKNISGNVCTLCFLELVSNFAVLREYHISNCLSLGWDNKYLKAGI